LKYEVEDGTIKHDWDEYLILAMKAMNNINMRRITWFLCKHEGEWYYPMDLKPEKEFDEYFRNDSLLDYLKERIRQLELSLEEADKLRAKLRVLQGEHNNLKGHYYERQVLLGFIKSIIDRASGLTEGISVTDFSYKLSFFLETGKEIDIVLEGEKVVIMAECKNYAPENIYNITQKMVEAFVEKARHLAKERFQQKELRLGYFSKHGFEDKLKPVLDRYGIFFSS